MKPRAWIVIGSLLLVPIALWATARPFDDSFAGSTATLGSLANITGLAGMSAFAVNLTIGSRLRVIVRLFGGLEAMYAAHARLAIYALALLAGHAVLATGHAATRSGEEALELFAPASGWAVFAGTVALACMAAALALVFFGKLSHEAFVVVQKALGVTFAVAALHGLGVPGTRSSTPLLVCLAVLTVLALAAFVHRSVLGRFLVRRHRYAVAAVNRLDGSVTEIRLEPAAQPISFLPGQFVFVSFRADTVTREPHPYSIASSPGGAGLAIVVKALGDHTATLMTLPLGALADIEGPYGAFSYLNVPNTRQIWIAGGIGVTPFLSMARSLDGAAREIDLYYCTEGPEHAHFLDELYAKADLHPWFRVVPVRTRSLGRISAEDIIGVSRPIEHDAAILICGPPAMIANLSARFSDMGVPGSRLYFEDFGLLSAARAAQ